jgi:hypothetical protein
LGAKKYHAAPAATSATTATTPHVAGRYSALHGVVDEQHAGISLRYGAHAVAPEYFRSFPTFDGDSIFNVFSISPYRDVRLTYELCPDGAAGCGYLRGWLRGYDSEDAGSAEAPDVAGTATAAGAQLGVRYRHSPWSAARVDVFHEDGYGGRRTGGYGALRWRVSRRWDVMSSLSVIRFDEDLLADLDGTTVGAQLGGTYLVNEGIAFHLAAEENSNRGGRSQLRLVAVLDLAFHPEI